MEDSPERGLKPRNRFEVTLESGLDVTLRLPYIRDMIASGNVSLPIMKQIEERGRASREGEQVDDLNAEQLQEIRTYNALLICAAVVELDHVPITLAPQDIVDYLTEDEYEEVVAYATREKDVPKADAPA